MFDKFFKKYTETDLLEALKDKVFKASTAEGMLKNVDIQYKDSTNKTFLHIVVELNLVESTKWLISQGVKINEVDIHGDTALMVATKKAATSSVRVLLSKKANANILNNEGRLAIQEAAKNNAITIFTLLKPVTKDLNNKDDNGISLIYDAIDSKNIDIVKNVLKTLQNKVDKNIFFYAGTYKNTEILKFLSGNLDLNTQDDKGRTPLFYLVKNGALSSEAFTYALSKGANIHHLDHNKNTVLMALVQEILTKSEGEKAKNDAIQIKNLIDMIPWLIEEEIDYNLCNSDGDNVLMLATKHKNLEIVENLLEFGVDPNYINERNETALAFAAMKGQSNSKVISLLLDYGARPNIADENAKTIIEKLIDAELFLRNNKKLKMKYREGLDEHENYKNVLEEVLLNGEVNLSMLNSEENPYFFDAVLHGNFNLVKMLVKYGADINVKNKEGYNIVYYLMAKNITFRRVIDQQNYLVMLRNIIGLGADVNSRDDFGGTTLHKAILDNDLQTIKVLLNAGADINAVDNRGRNMIHNTMWQNKVKIFRLLYSYNKKLINQADKFGVLPINYAAFLGYGEFVIELIDSGSYVNNPYRKTPYIFNFLKKFHKNIKPLLENTRNPANQKKMKTLLNNMIKEFSVKI